MLLRVDNEAASATGPGTIPNGSEMEGEGAWHRRKHGGVKRRVRGSARTGVTGRLGIIGAEIDIRT
ncbi:hypothetical protein [Poseidonocella sp. HB161398]|uniref:hypothetical protein n=1 Tax=Poseidonocella sp. HB161398 TaxID=2320855 RepID=UPI001107DBD0|nr:hypothetical protein [Poseidonocella sp. HB161398]